MQDDPAIARVREVRHRISKQFDHDPKKLVEYYMQLQERHKDRLLDLAKLKEAEEEPTKASQGTHPVRVGRSWEREGVLA